MIPLLRRTPLKRRPLAYRRRTRKARPRPHGASRAPVIHFEPPPQELPVATLHGANTSLRAQAALGLTRWISARLAWLKPRAVPVAVALIGMFAVLNAVNYLAKPPRAPIASSASSMADQPAYTFHIKVVLQQ